MKLAHWLLIALAAALLAAMPAQAQDTRCDGTIGGATLTGDGQRIVVPPEGSIEYEFSAAAPVTAWTVDMDFGGATVGLSEGTSDSGQTTVSGSADIEDYASFGAGLYEVNADVRLADGTSCTANVLIEVDQNPLATAAGWVAIGAGAGGIAMAAGGSAVAAKAALAALLKP